MKLKENIRELLIYLLEEGLDEDAYFRSNFRNSFESKEEALKALKESLELLKKGKSKFQDDSLEINLLNLVIKDVEDKLEND